MQRSAKRYLIVQRDTQCHDCERFDNLADSYVILNCPKCGMCIISHVFNIFKSFFIKNKNCGWQFFQPQYIVCVCRILSFYGRFLRLFVLFGRNFNRLCIKKRASAVLLHSRRALQASLLGEAVRFAD